LARWLADRIALPTEPLLVRPVLEAVRSVDPTVRAVREGGEVVHLPPDEQAAGGPLLGVAVRVVEVLVFEARADLLGADQLPQRGETEHESARLLGVRGLAQERCREQDHDEHAEH
jgi:hypothetical protein